MTELAVSLAVLLLLSALLAGLLARAAGQARTVSSRLETVEARRVTRDLLDHGVRAGGVLPGSGAGDRDRVRLRSFVGHGEGCGDGVFAYRGRRRPDPARDSVWVLRDDGTWTVTATGPVRSGVCPPGPAGGDRAGVELPELAPDRSGASPVVLRFFEPGRYTLSDALRYGRTGSPAQPLTGPVLDPSRSELESGQGEIRARVAGAGDSALVGRGWGIR